MDGNPVLCIIVSRRVDAWRAQRVSLQKPSLNPILRKFLPDHLDPANSLVKLSPEAMIPVTLSTLLYPFGKRPFFRRLYIYPQYMLGYTLAHPSLIGWLAIKGHDQPITSNVRECLALGTTVFLWVLYLNTAYSYQDIKDDQRMKLNSMYTVAGPYIHALLVLLAGLVLGAAALQLKEQNSQWLWGSWMCVSTYSFVSQLLRFDALNPISGGPLHKENCGLGIWTIFACSIELALKK